MSDLARWDHAKWLQQRLGEARNEVAMHVAALDAIEVALFGSNWRRSRDELVERAEKLDAQEAELTRLRRIEAEAFALSDYLDGLDIRGYPNATYLRERLRAALLYPNTEEPDPRPICPCCDGTGREELPPNTEEPPGE